MIESLLRLLLVEDNLIDQRVLRNHLDAYELIDFEIETVGDLGSALDLVAHTTYDCILLDLSLPDSEGLASIDALLSQSAETPIVVLTGLADPTTSLLAVERGAQDYLTKGQLDSELIGRSINYAVARHHSDTELRLARDRLQLLEERDRIARDLHDTVIQQLFATGMGLQATAARLDQPDLRSQIEAAVDGIDAGVKQLREAISGLHDRSEAHSVADTILAVARAERHALGFEPTVRLDPRVDRLDDELAHDLVATMREGLSNVAKHAEATTAQVLIEIADDVAAAGDGTVVLRIIDNGIGLSPTRRPDDPLSGRGLANMRRRAEEQTGDFAIGPGPGGGTELTWRAPLTPR